MSSTRNIPTEHSPRKSVWDSLKNIPDTRLAWLWLMVGFALLPFIFFNLLIPLAVWLAPVFLLRFVRTCGRPRLGLLLIFAAYAAAILIATMGAGATTPILIILGIVTFPLIKGLMFTLPYIADRVIGARLGPRARVLVFPLAYSSVDWLMSLSKVITSMGSPAYTQTDNLALTQIVSITGMWGLTFLIMWFASTVNALWEHGFDWRPVRGILGIYAGLMLAVLLFGSVRLNFFAPSAPSATVATVTLDSSVKEQASTGIDWATFNQSTDAQRAAVRPQFEATVNQLLARTETALRGGAKIVAWEEGAATVLEEDRRTTLARIGALAKAYDAYLQVSFGVIGRSQTLNFIQNQSILVDNTGTVRWTYNKTYLAFPIETFTMIAGDGKLPLADTPYGRLSIAICNDLHFPPLVRQAGAGGADIFLAPYHSAHPYELEDTATATVRAVENGFSLVRPAGTGFSTVTDYEGRTLARQNFFTNATGILLTTVPLHGVATIYSRIGDLFAYLCIAGLLALIAWAFFHRKQTAETVRH